LTTTIYLCVAASPFFALLLVRTGPGAEVGTHYDGHEWRA